jgi:hypothetical protein
MSIRQKIVDFWNARKWVEREVFGDNYWIQYIHRNPFHYSPEYDGKWVTRADFQELKRLEDALLPYVKSGELQGFKLKNPETPMKGRFTNDVPPIFVYARMRDKNKVYNLLTSLGVKGDNLEWIEDEITPEARNVQIMLMEHNMPVRRLG